MGKKYIEPIISSAVGDMRENIETMTEAMENLQIGITEQVGILKNLLSTTGATITTDLFTNSTLATAIKAIVATAGTDSLFISNLIPIKNDGALNTRNGTNINYYTNNSTVHLVKTIKTNASYFRITYKSSDAEEPATITVKIDGETLDSYTTYSTNATAGQTDIPEKFKDGNEHIFEISWSNYVNLSNMTLGYIHLASGTNEYLIETENNGYGLINSSNQIAVSTAPGSSGYSSFNCYINKPDTATLLVGMILGGQGLDNVYTEIFDLAGNKIGNTQQGKVINLGDVSVANGYGVRFTYPNTSYISDVSIRYL